MSSSTPNARHRFMSFRKILSAIDFSPASQQAMRIAIRLANESGAELVIAHSWHVPAIAYGAEPYEPDIGLLERTGDDARRRLDDARREAGSLGALRVSTVLRDGVPWLRISELLEGDPAFDLVVVGTHGRTGLKRVLLGSVAEKLVRHAPCSVLVVRPDDKAGSFTDILCPVDFSEDSKVAARTAVALAPAGATVTLLHAIEAPVGIGGETFPQDFLRDLDRSSTRALAELAAGLQPPAGVAVTTRTRVGYAGSQILGALEDDRRFDLVVMGSHGRTGLRRVLLGSVAEKVVRHAHCPVLVARRRP
jgi:nucleotide-binding universal stress UspA family protein